MDLTIHNNSKDNKNGHSLLTSIIHKITGREPVKDVDLVLSSGGARGLAHIGAILQLEEEGFRIRSVAGTSMGALVAGFYAAGKLDAFRLWMQGVDRKRIMALSDFSLGKDHIVKGERIMRALQEVISDCNIEDLPIPYRAIATDLKTGREEVFASGSLFHAIRASISIPTFFQPLEQEGKLLVDGGIINPFPLNRVVRTKGHLLVGVNVSGQDFVGRAEMRRLLQQKEMKQSLPKSLWYKFVGTQLEQNFYTTLQRMSSIQINQNAHLMAQLVRPDIFVDLPMARYGGFDYDKSERFIEIGRKKMAAAIRHYQKR